MRCNRAVEGGAPSPWGSFASGLFISATLALVVAGALKWASKRREVVLRGAALTFTASLIGWFMVKRCSGAVQPHQPTGRDGDQPVGGEKCYLTTLARKNKELVYLIASLLDHRSALALGQASRDIRQKLGNEYWKARLTEYYPVEVNLLPPDILENHPCRTLCLWEGSRARLLAPDQPRPWRPFSLATYPSSYHLNNLAPITCWDSHPSFFGPHCIDTPRIVGDSELDAWSLSYDRENMKLSVKGEPFFVWCFGFERDPICGPGFKYQREGEERLLLIGQEGESDQAVVIIKSKTEVLHRHLLGNELGMVYNSFVTVEDKTTGSLLLLVTVEKEQQRKTYKIDLWSGAIEEYPRFPGFDIREGDIMHFEGREIVLTTNPGGRSLRGNSVKIWDPFGPLAGSEGALLQSLNIGAFPMCLKVIRTQELQLLFVVGSVQGRISGVMETAIQVWRLPQEGEFQPTHLYNIATPNVPEGFISNNIHGLELRADPKRGYPVLSFWQSFVDSGNHSHCRFDFVGPTRPSLLAV